MISSERISDFINSFDPGYTPFLEEVRAKAEADNIPIVRREMQSFLRTMMFVKKPKRILEVGAAVGFSALLMACYAPADAKIITIENYEKRIRAARENIHAAGMEDKIELIEGDANEVLDRLTGTFDLVFMDAAKGQYLSFFPKIKKLMAPGSILISDNILQEGEILESKFIVERRDRTIHKRMREYLYVLKHDSELDTSIIPLGDGITLSVMKDPAL